MARFSRWRERLLGNAFVAFVNRWRGLFFLGSFIVAILIVSQVRHGGSIGGAAFLLLGLFGGLGLAFSVGRWSPRLWLTALNALRSFLPLVAFFVTLYLIDYRGEAQGTDAFHAAAAQIIPLLLLALAIEGRVFRIRESGDPRDMLLNFLTIMLLAVGEYHALKSVYSGIPEAGSQVAGAIAAGFTGMAVLAATGPPDERGEDDADDDPDGPGVKKPEQTETSEP